MEQEIFILNQYHNIISQGFVIMQDLFKSHVMTFR